MRFSVVIPCFNGADFLGDALRSVASQTHAPCEVLVVDDGSTDDSVAIARRHGATVLGSGANGGAARARNLGIAAATGDAVAFLDADDVWHPTHLATLAQVFDAVPLAGVAYTGVRDTRGRLISIIPPEATLAPLDLRWQLLRSNPIAQSGAAARLASLREVGGYDDRARHAEDYDLWLRLSRVTTFACAPAVTATYRLHAGQTTQDFATMRHAVWRVRTRAVDRLADEGGAPEDLARARRVLLEAWEAELAEEWRARCTASLDVVLGLCPLVPDAAATYRRWRWRRRWLWHLELLAHGLLQRLPPSWRRRLQDRRAAVARI